MTRPTLRRLVPAALVALAVGLLGFGVVGVAAADGGEDDEGGDGPVLFKVAPRHGGDAGVVAYRSEGGGEDAEEWAFAYTWGPEEAWLDGSDGTWHAVHGKAGLFVFHQEGLTSSYAQRLYVETSTGRTVGSGSTYQWTWAFPTGSPLPLMSSGAQVNFTGEVVRWSSLACGLDQAVHAGLRVDQPVVLVDRCLADQDDPVEFTVDSSEVDGLPTVRFSASLQRDGDRSSLAVHYNEAIPEALLVEREGHSSDLGAFRMTERLTGFQPGSLPWDTGIALPPPVPLPPVELAPRQPWGADDSGVDHPFPASAAWQKALEDPQFEGLRGFMAAHPGAWTDAADYTHQVTGSQEYHTWSFLVTDGQAAYNVMSSQTTGPPGALATDFAGLPPVPGPPVTTYQAGGGEGSRWCSDPPSALLPTAASAMARWEAYAAATTGASEPATGWSLGCGIEQHSELRAGRMAYRQDGMTALGLATQAPQRSSSDDDVLSIGADGQVLSHVRSTMDGEYTQQVGTGTTGGVAEQASRGDPLPDAPPLALAGVAWMPPAGPAASGAAAASLLAGALYWLWPTLKGGAAGLFSRIQGPRVLDHPQRRAIADLVAAQPGIHYLAIQRALGGGKGALQHHLEKLVAAGIIERHTGPGFTCFVPRGTGPGVAAAAGALKASGARAILAAVRDRPGLTASDVAAATGLDASTVTYHVRRLGGAGLVRATRVGRTVRLDATPLSASAALPA